MFSAHARVALFRNDRQLRDILYREERAKEPQDRLRLWPLDAEGA